MISLHHEDAHPQQEDSQDKMHDSDNCMSSSLPRSASLEKVQNTIEVRNHPKYSKYFKMLKMVLLIFMFNIILQFLPDKF